MQASKYDNYILWQKLNPSNQKLVSQIKPGSTVLECGCATGYVTKVLKEELDCHVYIVELERAAFETAINYSEGGVCCDLMGYEWTREFRGMEFDYILFSDVLEHLYDPWTVLSRAVNLLKDTGEILVSLPNVTNSNVLAKMYCGHWDYSKVGLLDETHIRFFGPYNLAPFFAQARLGITKMDYTYSRFFGNDQRPNHELLGEEMAAALLKNRWGEVYQFIITAQKMSVIGPEAYAPIEPPEEAHLIMGNLYYAHAQEAFLAGVCYPFGFRPGEDFEETFHIEAAEKIRLDPIEGVPCLLRNLQVTADGEPLTPVKCNGKHINDIYVFGTNDPQIVFELPENTSDVCVKAQIIPAFGPEGIKLVKELYGVGERLAEETRKTKTTEQRLATSQKNAETANQKMKEIERDVREKLLQLLELNDQLQRRDDAIAGMGKELFLAKDALSAEKEERTKLQEELSLTKSELKHCRDKIDELTLERKKLKKTEKSYNRIVNSTFWKATKPVRAILNLIKKPFRRKKK